MEINREDAKAAKYFKIIVMPAFERASGKFYGPDPRLRGDDKEKNIEANILSVMVKKKPREGLLKRRARMLLG